MESQSLRSGITLYLEVMSTYGIELLPDNIAECRANMLEVFADFLSLDAVMGSSSCVRIVSASQCTRFCDKT